MTHSSGIGPCSSGSDPKPLRLRVRVFACGGYTLLELLLVLVIFSLVTTLAYPYLNSGLANVALRATSRKIAKTLDLARVMALRDRRNYYARVTQRLVVLEPETEHAGKIKLPMSEELDLNAGDGKVIVFYPGGGSSGGSLLVKGSGVAGGFVIEVEPSTGNVKTYRRRGKFYGAYDAKQAPKNSS